MTYQLVYFLFACIATHLVVTFHSAVVSNLKAETTSIAATARKAELEATYFEQRAQKFVQTFAQGVEVGAGKIRAQGERLTTDLKQNVEKI